MPSNKMTRHIPLHLRNASTEDAIQNPYKIPSSLQAAEVNAYFVLQYKVESISDEEELQLETGYKMKGKDAVEISEKEEKLILDKLKKGLEKLENDLKKKDKAFKIIAPLSSNGWLLKSSKKKEQLEKIDSVYFVDAFHPAFKLTGTLFEKAIKPSGDKISIVLSLFPGADVKTIESKIKSVKGTYKVLEQIDFDQGKEVKIKVVVALISEKMLATIAQLPDVHLIEESSAPGITLADAHGRTGVDTAVNAMAAINPAPPALNGNGQIIGVYDTGVDNGNDANLVNDLINRVTGDTNNWNNNVQNVNISWADRWYNGVGNNIPGHGTGVTGVAIGNGNISGVAPGAGAIIRPFSADFRQGWPNNTDMIFDINTALTNAYGQGARIHNNSWGETSGNNLNNLTFFHNQYRISDRVVDDFTWNRPKMLVVAAAGNSGRNGNNTITSPGTGKNVLTVGASGNGIRGAGNNSRGSAANAVAGFSSRGPALNNINRLKPEVVAPGDEIATIRPQALNANNNIPAHPNHNQYSYWRGTSFSSPYVSGMAALVRQFLSNNAFHNGNGEIGRLRTNPSGMLVKAFIVNGARRLNVNGAHIPNNDEGYGLVDLDQSINPARLKLVYDSRDANDPNNANAFFLKKRDLTQKTFTLNNLSNNPLSITLAWYDKVDGGGTGALICDLDLILKHTNTGDIYRGGVPGFNNSESRRLNTGRLKRNGSLRDHTNAVEKIYIAQPTPGNYTLRVKVRNIPRAGWGNPAIEVPFALVVAQD